MPRMSSYRNTTIRKRRDTSTSNETTTMIKRKNTNSESSEESDQHTKPIEEENSCADSVFL